MSAVFNVSDLPGYGTPTQYQPSGTGDLSPRDTCGDVCVWVCFAAPSAAGVITMGVLESPRPQPAIQQRVSKVQAYARRH